MAQIDTFLKQRDKRRWAIDRLVSLVIKLGGIGVLVALVLLIVYLILIIAPIFSAATITQLGHHSFFENSLGQLVKDNQPLAVGVDEQGKTTFIFSQQGDLIFQSVTENSFANNPLLITKGNSNTELLKTKIMNNPSAFRAAMVDSGWYAYANSQGQIKAVKPTFSSIYTNTGYQVSPTVTQFADKLVSLDPAGGHIVDFDFAINTNKAIFIGRNPNGDWHGVSYSKPQQVSSFSNLSITKKQQSRHNDWQPTRLDMPDLKLKVLDYRVTPDAKTVYILSRDSISVLERKANRFVVRETVSLSPIDKADQGQKSNLDKLAEKMKLNDPKLQRRGVNIQLLSGANSLLVTDENGQVSQWFDVLKKGRRQLTHIRDFQLSPNVDFILPDYYRKGFYSFHQDGRIENFYTTSRSKVISQHFSNNERVLVAGVSANEKYVVSASKKGLNLYLVENPYPEISFSSLWEKVWYEGYPEAEYIWQSTSASNDYEPKFSFIPIAFGTLKAAIFAMIFAVPISIFGAIYTGYFMTEKMRRYVKPTIELMEALPTVIVGFLAGLWLAPIVEINLLSSLLFLITLPIVILMTAFIWKLIRQYFGLKEYQGWAALMLIPVVISFGWLIAVCGHSIEHWLFGGDIRLFLANIGVGFDQRNALIVGFAMGFAVIPTIFTIAEDAIFSVPKHLSDGARALGATSWQCLTTVVLVTASPGIFSAVMMGLGRAVGETMIVLMATGNTPVMDWNILEGMRTLSANIAIEMPESEVGGSHFRLLFLSALLLFVFTFVVNSIAEVIRQRLKEKYSAL